MDVPTAIARNPELARSYGVQVVLTVVAERQIIIAVLVHPISGLTLLDDSRAALVAPLSGNFISISLAKQWL